MSSDWTEGQAHSLGFVNGYARQSTVVGEGAARQLED